jgi:hypothetical protein
LGIEPCGVRGSTANEMELIVAANKVSETAEIDNADTTRE